MTFYNRPKASLFEYLTYDNHYLKLRLADCDKTISTLEDNISNLNRFVLSHYDASFAVNTNVKMIVIDCSSNVLSCIHSDMSGNFVSCADLSDNYLPCVLNPTVTGAKNSKTHISDASRCLPYYPYYPYYDYPYHYDYPYYDYPYLFSDDDYFNRSIDLSGVNQPTQRPQRPHPPNPPHPKLPQPPQSRHPQLPNTPSSSPRLAYGKQGATHIHIHPH